MTSIKVSAVLFGLLVAVTIFTALGSWYTIDQGQRGVILRNGAIVGVAQPGLNFKVPWIDSVQKISVQTHTVTYEKLNSYSFDQQPADLKVSVTYHVDPARVSDIYSRFGSVDQAVSRVLNPIMFRDIKIVFGRFSAVTAIQKRDQLNNDAKDVVLGALGSDGIVVESVNVEDIGYSPGYIHNIEQRMKAEVEVQQLRQNALREKVQAEITQTRAEAEANAVKSRANAEASAIQMRGDAEAKAITAKGAALRDNPQLVELVKAERWNGAMPTTMVPGGATPMLSIGSSK
ncbi:MAG: DUF2756 domain-containing protein [Rhizobiaceae bacterium]|nr:DUF2756 domain-containing protein [Rhizobiaceae bacterium]MCC0000853.1 DUF2756 domain-containing protein [Methylobacteriaceae bacterium]